MSYLRRNQKQKKLTQGELFLSVVAIKQSDTSPCLCLATISEQVHDHSTHCQFRHHDTLQRLYLYSCHNIVPFKSYLQSNSKTAHDSNFVSIGSCLN